MKYDEYDEIFIDEAPNPFPTRVLYQVLSAEFPLSGERNYLCVFPQYYKEGIISHTVIYECCHIYSVTWE